MQMRVAALCHPRSLTLVGVAVFPKLLIEGAAGKRAHTSVSAYQLQLILTHFTGLLTAEYSGVIRHDFSPLKFQLLRLCLAKSWQFRLCFLSQNSRCTLPEQRASGLIASTLRGLHHHHALRLNQWCRAWLYIPCGHTACRRPQ